MSTEALTFESSGLKLAGNLVLPEYNQHALTAVCITGGGKSADELYAIWQQHMAAYGIASFAFDARGKGGSEGEWSSGNEAPDAEKMYNSQQSRVHDTVAAIDLVRTRLADDVSGNIALIGSSMGGDIAVKACALLENEERPRGMVLKAPAAYHPYSDDARYGREFQRIITNTKKYPSQMSINFSTILKLQIASLLFYANGDDVIPAHLRAAYIHAVDACGGETIHVGDATTPHDYFFCEDLASKEATEKTYDRSTHFLLQLANR